MKAENKAILDQNRHFHETLVKAQYLKGLNSKEKDDLLRVMREEFSPNYSTDMWCAPCLADFVRAVYRMYDEWLVRNPQTLIATDASVELVEVEVEVKELVTPEDNEAIKVAATFPLNEPAGEADLFTGNKGASNNKKHHRK